MKEIKDLIIISDLDGTAIPMSGKISEKNINAVKYFTKLGGTFTIATGRTPRSARAYYREFCIEGAMIGGNGSMIYDTKTNVYLHGEYLDDSYKQVLRKVYQNFPKTGMSIIGVNEKEFIANKCKTISDYLDYENIKFDYVDMDTLPDKAHKVLFLLETPEDKILPDFMDSLNDLNFTFVHSGGTYFEMLPRGISKGHQLQRLLDTYGKKIENTIAIGDFYNDVEMIKLARLGVAVGNAPDDVKGHADLIVKSCEEDAIADLIEYVLNNLDKI